MVTCVVTLIKDEHRYLQEYIEYYINLGIDTIFIYEDMNSKSHKEICDKYNNVIYLKLFEEITTEEKNRWINQEMPEYRVELLFKAFYRKYKELYDAVFFFDVDEYLDCPSKDILYDYINKVYQNPNKKFIKFQWRTMTANGHIKDPHPGETYSLINTYTKVCPDIGDLNVNGKCCIFIKRVNLDTDIIYVPHWYGYCYYYNSYFDNITELYPPFTLKHMLTKSWEEYCDRMFVRGEMNNYKYSKKMELFFEINPEFKDIQEELISKETREYKYNNRYKIIK